MEEYVAGIVPLLVQTEWPHYSHGFGRNLTLTPPSMPDAILLGVKYGVARETLEAEISVGRARTAEGRRSAAAEVLSCKYACRGSSGRLDFYQLERSRTYWELLIKGRITHTTSSSNGAKYMRRRPGKRDPRCGATIMGISLRGAFDFALGFCGDAQRCASCGATSLRLSASPLRTPPE